MRNHWLFVRTLWMAWLMVGIVAPATAQFTLDREPPGPCSRRTGLVITEIMYHPQALPGLSTNLTLEFVELYNSKPWDENIGGYFIDGDVQYQFPPDTVLVAGGYLVLARVPELVKTHYGLEQVWGPWDGAETNRLSTEEGLVRLRNRQGAVLLQIEYEDSPPWPEAADGTGHSLCLMRPSYGENDSRAWAQSDSRGGSPGGPDPVTQDPLASVLINEWQNHSDPVDWVELYNHSNQPVDLSGAYLSDDPVTNLFRIPNGTVIPPRGFLSWDQNQLGFELFAGGETVFFWSSNQARIIDVIDFRGQSNNVSSGRWPDGGPLTYGLASRTRGGPNSNPIRYAVVINEIMYNPPSGSTDDEYVELHNRSSRSVDLSGWEFVVGINYVFPTNALTRTMAPGAYWVVARNPEHLMALYPQLNTNNTFGPYSGSLANGGERVVFAAADYDRVDGGGISVIERLAVPISELTYGDGGKWTDWSDGKGSSLELVDPEGDQHHPSNWADSEPPDETLWTTIEMDVPLGETLGPVVNDRLILMLQGSGECLLDEVEVRVDQGPNLVVNGGFESGLEGWVLQGSHDFSTLAEEGFSGTRSLHVRAGSRGDNQSNRILSPPFPYPIPDTVGTVSIRAKAKWRHGSPELLLRLHGSATEAYGRMAVPRRLGSPGLANSRLQSNLGPAIYQVRQHPPLPAPQEPVRVTARAVDPQGLASLVVRFRVDPEGTYTDLAMVDDGTGADEVAADGLYSAWLPGQEAGVMAAFYIEGQDPQNAVGTFPKQVFPEPGLTRCWPNDAVVRECLVRWGEVQMPGDFATYHLWVSAVNSNRWHVRNAMNNAEMDGTFVYNQSRVIYNALPLFSGSPWHRTNSITGPAGPHRVDYEMNFPDDEPLLGSTDFVLNNCGNPDILTLSDLSALAEQTVYQIFEGMGMPHNHRRYIHMFVNGSQRSTAYERPGNFIFEDSQQPNGEMIEEWFPDDAGGQLFKLEDWFEFEDNGFDVAAHNDADLTRRTALVEEQPVFLPAPYRYMFRKRSTGGGSENDFTAIYELIDAVSPADDPESATLDPDRVGAVVDWEAWMRHFAVQRAVGNWDSYGWDRGKNDYLYRAGGGFVHMPWDIDYSLGLGRPANAPLFESSDARIVAMFKTPAIVRAYWRAFADLVAGPFRNEYLDPFIDARAQALLRNDINIDLDAVASIKAYIGQRRMFLQDQLATVEAPFALEGPLSFSTTNNLVVITGTAPVQVKEMALNGAPYPVTWTTVSNFSLRVVLDPGWNEILVEGWDRFGEPVADAAQSLSLEYTGPVVEPDGALVISEIMYAPAVPGAQFIEIQNRSPLNFDLTGWWLSGVDLTFPPGSIVTNGQILVVVRDRNAFQEAYGHQPLFGVFGGALSLRGELIQLIRPGLVEDEMINGLRYETQAPWPSPAPGVSLQLIDVTQDNRRVSNWALDPTAGATPGLPNSVAQGLPPFAPLWLNEIQVERLQGLVDNAGDPDPWLELYNAGPDPVSLEGYYLATRYTDHLTEWPFPDGLVVPGGTAVLIWVDGEPQESTESDLHTNFRLEYRGQLALVRLLDDGPQITDYLSWPTLGANLAYGNYPDGQPLARFTLPDPTPQAANTKRIPSVLINEWMARNSAGLRDPADGDYEDWFELYNTDPFPVDLGGYYLTDDAANPSKFLIPDNGRYQIPAGGFLLVWADNEPDQNAASRPDLHVDFALGGGGGDIGLFARDGVTPVDLLAYDDQTSDISEGRYGDGGNMRFFMVKSTPGGPNSIPDYNTRPRFPVIPDQFITPGGTNTVTIRAFDPDAPPQILTYAMDAVPPVSALNQGGLYRWIAPTNQPPGDYYADLRVTDNGTPPRSDTVRIRFTVVTTPVVEGPTAPIVRSVTYLADQVTFTLETVPGAVYRVFHTDNLVHPNWIQLDRDFTAANPTASLTDSASVPQRFYRVERIE